MRILVVEDDDLIGELLEMILGEMGHDVILTRDPEGALQRMIQAPEPELLVTDFNLGGVLTGVDVAESFVNRYPKAPVLVISGRPEEAKDKITPRCHAGFLPKPFRADDLSAAIDGALALARAA